MPNQLFRPGNHFSPKKVGGTCDVCRQRDQEGLYGAADQGEIANFPGVSAPYEEPTQADLVLGTHELDVDECVDRIMKLLEEGRIVSA